MASNEPYGSKIGIDFLIPFRPNPIEPLKAIPAPLGERVVWYYGEKLRNPLPQSAIDSYRQIDAKRTSLLSSVSVEKAKLFVEYLATTQCLFGELDLSPSGVDIIFSWNGQSKNEIGFDFCCLGLNLIANGLHNFSTGCFTSLQSSAENIKLLGALKLVYDKILNYIQFSPVPWTNHVEETLWAAQAYVLSTIFFHNKKYEESSKSIMAVVSKLRMTQPKEYTDYLTMFAVAVGCTGSTIERNLVKTFNYLSKSEPLEEQYKKPKTKDKFLAKKLTEISDWLKAKREEQKRVAPSSIAAEKGFELQVLEPILPFKIPEITVVETPSVAFKEEVVQSINNTLNNFRENVEKAVEDQISSYEYFPESEIEDLKQKYHSFAQLRDMVVQKVMNFEQILYGRAAQLGPRYQNVAASYNSYRQKLVQAQQTDQIGDQNVAVARNLVQPLVDIVGNLKSVKAEMESIVATVEKLLGETEEFPNENPSAVLNLKMKTHGQLQTHSQNLQSLCSKNHELCNQLRSLGQSIINNFRASYHTAMNGMTQGQMFYSNLDKAITQLERTG